MQSSRRVVLVGVPGVGKTTVTTNILKELRARGVDAQHVVFGSVMMEEATKIGVKHRDEMRRLPIGEQRTLQVNAARAIAGMNSDFLFVDTHLFIITKEGYWPGLPHDVLMALVPTNLILIEAEPTEILARRKKDEARVREGAEEGTVALDLAMARVFLGSASILTGAPMCIVKNREGRAEEAAQEVLRALEVT